MVQGFGVLLVVGVGAGLRRHLHRRRRAADLLGGRRAPRPLRALGAALDPAWRGAGELLTQTPPGRTIGRAATALGRGALAMAAARPQRVLGLALLAAVLGWVAHTQTRVESDVQKLVPQDLRALRDLRALQESTGVGGEIDVVVSPTSSRSRRP